MGKKFDICLAGVGNIEPKVSNDCFSSGAKSLTALSACLDKMGEFKGRDIAFVSDWLTQKKVLKSCL